MWQSTQRSDSAHQTVSGRALTSDHSSEPKSEPMDCIRCASQGSNPMPQTYSTYCNSCAFIVQQKLREDMETTPDEPKAQ